jgi:hypothetical protein
MADAYIKFYLGNDITYIHTYIQCGVGRVHVSSRKNQERKITNLY